MKKLLTMLILLLAVVTKGWATETVIWQGSTTLDWGVNPGVTVVLDAYKFAIAKSGATLKIEGTAVSEAAQVQVCVNYPWKSSDSYTSFPINYSFADGDLENIKSNGMTLCGQNATITKVIIDDGINFTPGENETLLSNTETEMASDWSKNIQIAAGNFANAKAGDIITVYVKDINSGSISLKSMGNGWPGLNEAFNSGVELDGSATKYEYSLTAENVTALHNDGLLVSGGNYTAVRVTLTSVSSSPTLYTLTITAPSNGTFTVNDGTNNLVTGASVPDGTTLTLSAIAAADYGFTKWTVNSTDYTDNPQSITVTGDTEISATFTAYPVPELSLDNFTADTGNTYESHALTATAWSGMQLYFGSNSTYSGSRLVIKTATAVTLKVMVYYNGSGEKVLEASSAITDHVVEIDNTKTINKIIIQSAETVEGLLFNSIALDPLYTITATSADANMGTATVETAPTSDSKYAYGTSVTVTATPESSYSFSQWKVGETSVSTDASYTFTATEDVALTAEFTVAKTSQALKNATQKMVNETVGTKVLIANSAFANVSAGDIITVNMSEVATSGAFIVLKENSSGTSLFGSNYSSALTSGQTSFIHNLTADDITLLTGGSKALCITGEGFTCGNITITSAGSITADAAHTTMYVLSVTQPTAGGTIQIGGTDAAAQKAYDNGSQVTLTAVRDGGYALSKWTKDDADAGSENTLSVTFAGADVAVTATFVEDGSDPNVIWDGNQTIDWNNSQFVQIAASKFTGMNLGDKLIFTIANSANNGQLQLTNSGWNVMAGTTNTPISEGMTQVVYYINNSTLTELANGLIISGVGFDLKEVKKAEGDGGDYSNAVWIGEKEMGSWGDQAIDKSVFANAAENQLLRVNFKGLSNIYAQMVLRSNNTDLTSYDPISGIYKQYTITSELLNSLQTYGLTIAGSGFTLTSVEVIDPSTIKNLTLSVPVTNDRIWSGNPTITISVTNNEATSVTAKAEIRVSKDNFESVTTVIKNEEVASGETKNIDFSFDAVAGFYRIIPVVNGEMACNEFVVGVNPTQIVSAPDKQSDFDSYWAAAKAQLDAIPINASLTEIASKSGTNRKVYLVEMQSVPDGTSGDPVTIRGYYAEPTDGKRHPVIVTFQGYDSEYRPAGQDATPYCMSGDNADSDYAEFILSTRGQCVNNRTAAERVADGKGDFTNTYGDWFAYQFGNKDSYYYRGAYMDCVRAIQFMASRSTSDMDNLFAQGQSQGGAFTYAAAALSGYTFKAIAPAITFMGDFPDYFELANWPASVARANQGTMSDDDMYAFLSYFDTKNLATKVSCPVITSIGVQDNVCPPHTNIAPYNNVTTASDKKQIVYNAELQHATNSDWYTTYMGFFGNYKTESEQDDDPTTVWTGLVAFSGTNFDTNDVLNTNNEKILAGVEAKDTIYIYTTSVATEASYQLQYKVGTGWTWTELMSGTSVPEIIKYAATAESAPLIAGRGLVISGSGYSIRKIALHKFVETPLTAGETRTLWENADGTDVSWNEIGTQGATLGAILEAGEKILVTVKSVSTTETDRQVCLRDANSEIVTGFSSFDEVTSYPYVAKFTLTSDYVDKLKNGFHISGTNTTVTKMELYKPLPDTRTEKNLYGEAAMDSTVSDGITIAAEKFVNISEDDVLMIYLSGTKATDFITLRETTNWTQLTSSYKEYMTAGQTVFTLTLNDVNVAKLKVGGLNLTGGNFTITKITIKTNGEIPADEGGEEEGGDDDDEPIIDEKTGEADLTELTAQDDTKTTLTQNEDGSITMTTTEAYQAAQIWFNDPETVTGNVLKVELAESKVNVTVTVKYTDGTESQMSANTKAVVSARATTRAVASGTTIEVPLETGKEVQNIEVKNNEAGTITIKKMQVTTINVFTGGVANLAMLKPQSNATYDTSAHTLATTKGWTGATVSPVAGENVSGKELLIEFADASKVKVSVKYRTDVEGPSKIMDKAAKSVRLALDNTKNIQEISIQPTEAAIITFTKIAVNSEESDDGSLKPGKTITLWESATGETLSWNEVAKQDASVGEMLKEYDELLITVSGVVKDCDWPKLFIRDASSEQAGNEVLLNDVGSFPYTVRIVLTGEMAQQLQKGFSICGDGVTVKKLQVYRPEAPKTGDIHLADLNYGYNSSYDKGSHTITTTARWAARGWEIGDKRYNDKNLITVKFEAVDFPVTLKMEYTTGLQTAQATSVGVPAGRTELLLEIPKGISKLNRVYIIYENPGKVKLTEASVTYMENLKLSTAIQAFEADGVIRDGRYDTDGWYNLRGMRIPEPTTSGIYIHGGKKVVIY